MREKILQTIRPLGDVSDAGAHGLPAPVGDHDLNAAPRADAPLTPAAVLVPLVERSSGLQVLLTQRTDHLHDHAGQVSFPGGGWEPHDLDIVATALRETHEEVGIAQDDVTVIGYLNPMPTITGYAVTPVVGVVSGDIELRLDHTEVEYSFEVPLPFLMDAGNQKMVDRELGGRIAAMAEYHYDGQRIWGATAYIICEFMKILKKE